jgi:hypothetical protein
VEIMVKADEGNFVRYQTDDGAEVLRDSGTLLPRKFVACFPDVHLKDGVPVHRGGPDLHLRFEMRGGMPQCRELFLQTHPEGREIRAADVPSASDLELYTEVACQMVALHVTEELPAGGVMAAHSGSQPDLKTVAKFVKRARRNPRRQIPDSDLPEVARVYRANPKRPTAAVAERFGLALRTASLYVKRAREAGLLEKEAGHGQD